MTRIPMVGVVVSAAVWLALSPYASQAQGLAVKVAAPVGVKTPVVRGPNLDTGISHQQRSSDFGVQINIKHKRDRLQGASGTTGTKTQ